MPLYKAAMRRFNSVGKVTIMGRNDGHAISVFKRLWEQEELTIRFRVAHGFARNTYRPEAIIKRVGNLSGFGDAWLKIAAANVGNPDGALGNGRGWTRKRVPEGTADVLKSTSRRPTEGNTVRTDHSVDAVEGV